MMTSDDLTYLTAMVEQAWHAESCGCDETQEQGKRAHNMIAIQAILRLAEPTIAASERHRIARCADERRLHMFAEDLRTGAL